MSANIPTRQPGRESEYESKTRIAPRLAAGAHCSQRSRQELRMNGVESVIKAASAGERVEAIDWARVEDDLDRYGCAVIEGMLGHDECTALVEQYPRDELYRSRVVMARHGFGRGEYKYFAYPLPEWSPGCATALYPRARADGESLERGDGDRRALSRRRTRISSRAASRRPDAADAAAAAVRRGRLQLPAPGPVRRACLSAAGGDSAVRARARFHRRRIRADRAAAAHAVARGGGAAARRATRWSSPCTIGRCRARAATIA